MKLDQQSMDLRLTLPENDYVARPATIMPSTAFPNM